MQRRWRLITSPRVTDWTTQHHPLRETSTVNDDSSDFGTMANFARSFKTPYLSPRLRPSMPSRTVSGSSDVSHNSPLSEDCADISSSARNTPTLPLGRNAGKDCFWGTDDFQDDHDTVSPGNSRPSTPRSRNSRSHPIAIELPTFNKRFGSNSVRTPPEPLSARGDLPGGYFPLHEDPTSRVHRPHPFKHQLDARMVRHQQVSLVADSRPAYPERATSNPSQNVTAAHSNTPVASYLPAGFHDNPLPMGKYYPSNYEQRTGSHDSLRSSFGGSISANFNSDPNLTPRSAEVPQISTPESEIQRRLQQYQRDMVAQASMAASELLGSSADSGVKLGTSVTVSSLRIHEGRLKPPAPLKPLSPRLLPLGSPGPVTPMSLESSGGGYMTLGTPEISR